MHTGNLMPVLSYHAGSGISDYTGLVTTLPNGLQLRPLIRDKVPYKQCLHVPYKSELIII